MICTASHANFQRFCSSTVLGFELCGGCQVVWLGWFQLLLSCTVACSLLWSRCCGPVCLCCLQHAQNIMERGKWITTSKASGVRVPINGLDMAIKIQTTKRFRLKWLEVIIPWGGRYIINRKRSKASESKESAIPNWKIFFASLAFLIAHPSRKSAMTRSTSVITATSIMGTRDNHNCSHNPAVCWEQSFSRLRIQHHVPLGP